MDKFCKCSTGAVYLNDCPRQHYIPIYLIVTGVFAFMLAVLSCLPFTHEPTEGSPNPFSRVCRVWNTLTSIFLLSWFIAGEFKQWKAEKSDIWPVRHHTTAKGSTLWLFVVGRCCVCSQVKQTFNQTSYSTKLNINTCRWLIIDISLNQSQHIPKHWLYDGRVYCRAAVLHCL